VKVKDTKIDSYQCVVPTTWNAGPRDARNQIGAYEAALMNTPMVNPAQPLEILRTIHSFDPARVRHARDVARGRELVASRCASVRSHQETP